MKMRDNPTRNKSKIHKGKSKVNNKRRLSKSTYSKKTKTTFNSNNERKTPFLITLKPGLKVQHSVLKKFFKEDPSEVLKRSKWKGSSEAKQLAKLLVNKASDVYHLRRGHISRALRILPDQLQIMHSIPVDVSINFIKQYQDYYENCCSHEGPGNVLKRLKSIAGVTTRFCAGHKSEKIEWVKYKRDLPSLVSPLRKYLVGDRKLRQGALTLINIYKLIKIGGIKPSIDSIIEQPDITLDQYGKDFIPGKFLQMVNDKKQVFNKSEIDIIIESFQSVLYYFDEDFGGQRQRDIDLQNEARQVHLSTKKGPNGPSIGSIHFDALAWRANSMAEPRESLLWILKYIFNPQRSHFPENKKSYTTFLNLFNANIEIKDREGKTPSPSDFELGVIREKIEVGGKTRLFAVVDWFTQTALKPLHNCIMNWAKKLPQDSSSDHNIGANTLRQWLKQKKNPVSVFSVDLTTATDSIPIIFQGEILAHLIGSRLGSTFAHHWCQLLTKRDFEYEGLRLRYNKGQPMGAYSSWAMLDIWHHAIIRTCFTVFNNKRYHAGLEPVYNHYVVIGDDVVLCHQEVYDLYVKIVRDLLGVRISPLKGFTPETADILSPIKKNRFNTTSGEIAKRVFTGDGEITPVPPNIWMEGSETPQGFTLLINELQRRDVKVSWEEVRKLASFTYQSKWSLLAVSFPWANAAFAWVGPSVEMTPQDIEDSPWGSLCRLMSFEYFCQGLISQLTLKYAETLSKYLVTKASALSYLRPQPGKIFFQFEVKGFKFESLYLENFLLELYLTPHKSKYYSDMLFQLQQILEEWTPSSNQSLNLPQIKGCQLLEILHYTWYRDIGVEKIFHEFDILTHDTYPLEFLLKGKPLEDTERRVQMSRFYYKVYREYFERSQDPIIDPFNLYVKD